jgi:hypothetical protein
VTQDTYLLIGMSRYSGSRVLSDTDGYFISYLVLSMRIFIVFFFWCIVQSAHSADIETGIKPANGLFKDNTNTLLTLLTYGEKVLLTLVLPLTIVGV